MRISVRLENFKNDNKTFIFEKGFYFYYLKNNNLDKENPFENERWLRKWEKYFGILGKPLLKYLINFNN